MSALATRVPLRGRLRRAVPGGPGALVAFSAAAVGAGLGRALLTTYLPVLLERIRDAPGLIGLVMLVNTLAGFVVPLVVGAWSDRLRAHGHGRTRPVVLGGTLVAAGGLLAVALGNASSYLLLALFAAVAYFGLNAVTTGHRALIPETFDEDGRAGATAAEELAILVGTLGGVVVGGVLVERAGWAPFLVGAVLLPLLALPTVRAMRGRERPIAATPRLRRGARYYAAAAARPGARLILLAQGLWVLGYVGLPPFFILYADHELALRPRTAALLLAAFGIATGAAMLLAGTVPPQRHRTALLGGAVAMGAGLLAVASTSSLAPVAVALLPVAAGFGVLTTLGFPVFASYMPVGEEGSYSALYFSVRSIASAVALPIAGWTIALTGSYRALFVLGGCVTLGALVPLARLTSWSPPRWWRTIPWARVAALALATAVALGVGVLIQHTELIEADEAVFDLLYGLGGSPQWLDALLVDSHIVNYAALTGLTAIAAAHWGSGRPLRAILTVGGAGVLAYASVRLCWAVWERPRPEEWLGTAPANDHVFAGYPSFPSGHVAVTTAIVTAAASVAPRLRVALWSYAAIIAVTRVSYGAHLPSDVVLGALLGWTAARVVLPSGLPRPRIVARPSLTAAARGLAVVALAVFLVLLATVGAPVSLEGGVMKAALAEDIQVALLAAAALVIAAAWRHPAAGAALLPIGAALGVFAALEYTPGFAVFACLAFVVPGTLFVLAWPRVRRAWHAGLVGALVVTTMTVGALAAVSLHEQEFGPAHPESSLPAPATWRVEWAWAGGVTPTSVRVNARFNEDGRARLLVAPAPDFEGARVSRTAAVDDDRPSSFAVAGLRPDTAYFYALEFNGRIDRDRVGRFTTFPRGRSSFRFAFGGCARVGSNGAVYDAIRRERPLLFLATGDFFYANIDESSEARFLGEYDRALGQPAQDALFRSTPMAYVWDDHDFGGDGSDATAESGPAARAVYRQAVPHYPLPDREAIYQAFTAGRVRFLLLDTRSERSPSDQPDDARKTMLGAEQKAWLERELVAARDAAMLTVVVSSVPWIAARAAGADHWGGYATERAELSRFIADHGIRNLLMLAGDAHMVAIDDGSHSDYSGTGRAGFPVMHAAALDRPGGVKGGPYSEGAFPGAGQFGTVAVTDEGDRLRVRLTGRTYDGRELVRHDFAVAAASR